MSGDMNIKSMAHVSKKIIKRLQQVSFSFWEHAHKHTHSQRARSFYCSHQKAIPTKCCTKTQMLARVSAGRERDSNFISLCATWYRRPAPCHISLSLYFIASHRFCHLWSWPELFLFPPRTSSSSMLLLWEPCATRQQAHIHITGCLLIFSK